MKNCIIWGRGKLAKCLAALCEEQNISYEMIGREGFPQSNAQCVIDFSHASALENLLTYCEKTKTPLIIATTGHSCEQKNKIKLLSQKIPLCCDSNFSLGVLAVKKAVTLLNSLLKDWDAEITETHRKGKADSPSGTALCISELFTIKPNIHSLRMGDSGGEHTVLYASRGEKITLTHQVFTPLIFAKGALICAQKLIHMPKGFYSAQSLTESNP